MKRPTIADMALNPLPTHPVAPRAGDQDSSIARPSPPVQTPAGEGGRRPAERRLGAVHSQDAPGQAPPDASTRIGTGHVCAGLAPGGAGRIPGSSRPTAARVMVGS
jgi:hypothetical protein